MWYYYIQNHVSPLKVSPKTTLSHNTASPYIDVGGGPSGPSIEGPFCRTVHLCRTLGERKVEKKRKKNEEKEGKIEKREKIALFIFYTLLSF